MKTIRREDLLSEKYKLVGEAYGWFETETVERRKTLIFKSVVGSEIEKGNYTLSNLFKWKIVVDSSGLNVLIPTASLNKNCLIGILRLKQIVIPQNEPFRALDTEINAILMGTLLEIRSSGDFSQKGFWLDNAYRWFISNDNFTQTLVPAFRTTRFVPLHVQPQYTIRGAR